MTATDEAPLLVRRHGAVVRAILNRPARRNAMNAEMVEQLDALLAGLAEDRTARVLVISGAGGHFCAGLDLTEAGAPLPPEEKLARQLSRNRRTAARLATIATLPQVVIAEVEGSAFAGGLGLVCAADIALASGEARFAAPEVRRGLVPAQILPWLAHRMGRSQAGRLVLQSATIDAPHALATGLVHEVLPDAAALAARTATLVADVLQGAPGALAETKALLAALGDAVPGHYAEAGAQAFARCAAGGEAEEGIAAFKARRQPTWAPVPA
ncbi:enoyl-CoA hydratase/isomerase family protein [Pseudoroseomonas wenyumeiae]|uniref:Enoyl-CoA hydratase/isomerase family protein n=1 Tax=Teichococcus wenyumeiae TaxID=2478470 RepID=A0A3A9JLA2_9PROT|nr:enoyl-CoA hydratase-related protein [Pseudoroseomonas wenyumeiae]RKK05961.1 enoyl-CoA hydratase/isomerase family protein [Pseudoroseomonas wenyumeiae]RMI19816.1 enoyl-CoA hydratase/isomerase family protein [Pseudoroseomonas wenyumeiae]